MEANKVRDLTRCDLEQHRQPQYRNANVNFQRRLVLGFPDTSFFSDALENGTLPFAVANKRA